MCVTDYHAKYFANDLTRHRVSGSVEKLASVLAGAQVDLNPHQGEAALRSRAVYHPMAVRLTRISIS